MGEDENTTLNPPGPPHDLPETESVDLDTIGPIKMCHATVMEQEEEDDATMPHVPLALTDDIELSLGNLPPVVPHQHHVQVSSLGDFAKDFNTGRNFRTPSTSDDTRQEAPYGYASVLQKIQKWGDYDCYGEVIRGSRVIPMKTPLTVELQKGYLPNKAENGETPRQFTLTSFLEDQRAAGRVVGLIIDLSNHDCLYRSDIPDGITYRHFIFVAKRLPDPENCRKVRETIHDYLEQNPDHFVAMHCSYGFNRTGFVCCSYLIEELQYTVEEALVAFKESRPPGVKHQDFVAELVKKHCDPLGEVLSIPQDHVILKRRGVSCVNALLTESKNHADVNNDSLGMITGEMVRAELMRELNREKGQESRRWGNGQKDCSVS